MDSPVTKQPCGFADKRDWHDGLFDCTNDCKTCCCVLFCYPCYMCHMYYRYGQCCGTPMGMLFPGLTLRVYHRAKHGIEGTLFNDCMSDYFCTMCAACQLDRDMHYVEGTNGFLDI